MRARGRDHAGKFRAGLPLAAQQQQKGAQLQWIDPVAKHHVHGVKGLIEAEVTPHFRALAEGSQILGKGMICCHGRDCNRIFPPVLKNVQQPAQIVLFDHRTRRIGQPPLQFIADIPAFAEGFRLPAHGGAVRDIPLTAFFLDGSAEGIAPLTRLAGRLRATALSMHADSR